MALLPAMNPRVCGGGGGGKGGIFLKLFLNSFRAKIGPKKILQL